jgi:uncharacterized repeat protein (TIGR01451 family)
VPPVIQWTSPTITIPAFDALTLRYWVDVPETVPLSSVPYTNTVFVSDTYRAEAGLLVGIGEVSVTKTANPTRALPGEQVTYTVTFDNHGYAPRQLTTISDTLPDGVTFETMLSGPQPSDISEPIITWSGPHTIPVDDLIMEYVASMPVTEDTLYLENLVSGQLDDSTVLTDSVEVKVATSHTSYAYFPAIFHRYAPPYFVLNKTANPQIAYTTPPGDLIAYEVTITNQGTVPGELADIRDTLPPGFSFERMLPGSDIPTGPPPGTSGEIVWTGPFDFAGESSLVLRYEVRASTIVGTYTNSATVTVTEGDAQEDPARATVQVVEPVLLDEDWESPSPYWEPFLNYWRLKPGQWHIASGVGVGGSKALKHTCWVGAASRDCDANGAEDALYMYLGPGSFDWENYRIEAKVKLNNTKTFQGIWVRGYHEESELNRRCVGGYIVTWRVGNIESIAISKFQDEGSGCGDLADPVGLAATEEYGMAKGAWYDMAVEVRGSNIKVFLNGTPVLEADDDTYPTGTVGFFAWQIEDGLWDNVLVTPLP